MKIILNISPDKVQTAVSKSPEPVTVNLFSDEETRCISQLMTERREQVLQRRREAIRRLLHGETIRSISRDLHMSPKTVIKIRRQIENQGKIAEAPATKTNQSNQPMSTKSTSGSRDSNLGASRDASVFGHILNAPTPGAAIRASIRAVAELRKQIGFQLDMLHRLGLMMPDGYIIETLLMRAEEVAVIYHVLLRLVDGVAHAICRRNPKLDRKMVERDISFFIGTLAKGEPFDPSTLRITTLDDRQLAALAFVCVSVFPAVTAPNPEYADIDLQARCFTGMF